MSSNASVSVKEPFIRLKRRTDLRWYQSWLIRIIVALLALVVNAIFINSLTGISRSKSIRSCGPEPLSPGSNS